MTKHVQNMLYVVVCCFSFQCLLLSFYLYFYYKVQGRGFLPLPWTLFFSVLFLLSSAFCLKTVQNKNQIKSSYINCSSKNNNRDLHRIFSFAGTRNRVAPDSFIILLQSSIIYLDTEIKIPTCFCFRNALLKNMLLLLAHYNI